ncbi:uncharacterized protein LOC117173614 [Belonocnema kinseyi]|uniref:uncharacterized protein LOC117173614 n=1 Tax=Belonocnema kinseyi TaxID=2817044 RepID=UPI00143CF8DF|nr:uncharacterized protein LOC117173614 [Belonocnema kinseyi]
MDTALRGLVAKIFFAYLDDIIVFGRTLEEDNENLVILFERLRATGLERQPDTCEFLRPELEYLGHVITENGVKSNSYQLSAVQHFERPEKQNEALWETTSESIFTNLLDHYIYIFSSPKHILTDQGANFVSELVQKFKNLFRIKHIKTTAFHQQSNGALERTPGTIKDLLKTYMADNEMEWDQSLFQYA